MSAVIDVLARGARREVENVKEFITTPKGVFETIDEIIVDARRTGRELVQTVRPGILGAQRVDLIPTIRRRIRILRR